MLHQLKNIVKQLIPPIIWNIYKNRNNKYGFFDNYSSWEKALKDSDGYDSEVVINKIKESMLKIKEGKAVYARDSFILDKKEYSFPILAILLNIVRLKKNKLSVLDFGGALGSHYFQYHEFFGDLDDLKWNIVEQPKLVECGKEFFENNQLKFYFDIDTCLENEQPDVIFLSGVIQCLDKPDVFIENILKYNFPYILVDRLGLIEGTKDLLTVQKVPPEIYESSYPSWFFNESKFLNYFQSKYDLISDFDGSDKCNIQSSRFKGYIFQLKKS